MGRRMKLKEGVKLTGIRPELLVGLMAAQAVYEGLGYDLVVTSVTDSKHSVTSLHYAGAAADLRTRHMTVNVAKQARDQIAAALPGDFDVILEQGVGSHIHIEWQARYHP